MSAVVFNSGYIFGVSAPAFRFRLAVARLGASREIHSGWMFMKLAQEQRILLRPMLYGQINYLLVWALVLAAYQMGLVHIGPLGLAAFFLIHFPIHAVFWFLVISGISKRFRDPGMTFIQILSVVVVQTPLLFFFDASVRGVMLCCYLIPLMFSGFRLSLRQSLHLVAYAMLGYLVVCLLLLRYQPTRIELREEALRFGIFSLLCVWMAVFSGHLFRLRGLLRHKRDELVVANRKLRQAQNKLVEAAHTAGMSEVAAEVLHNIGHTLNSIGVSADLLEERLQKPRFEALEKTALLIEDHHQDMVGFFAEGNRREMMVHLLQKLSAGLQKGREASLAELQHLREYLERLREILALHREYAHKAGVKTKLDPKELIEDFLAAHHRLLSSHKVEAQVEAGMVAELNLQPSKLHHVLDQLLLNAVDVLKHRTEPRLVIIRVWLGESELYIEFEDNGPGIPESEKARVFTHGFTTKADGLGLGLHYAGNAVVEMGGKIELLEPRNLDGACFRIVLPIDPT